MAAVAPFDFAAITATAPRQWQLITIFGEAGIGKTTLVCTIPRLFLVCPEDGLSNIPDPLPQHFPRSPRNINELYIALDTFAAGNRLRSKEERFNYVAIDNLSWVELMIRSSAREGGSENLGSDYQAGWEAARAKWDRFAAYCVDYRKRAGVHLILLAHSAQRVDSNESGDTWQKWDLDLDKKAGAGALVRKLSDHVVYLGYSSRVTKGGKGKRAVGSYSGRLAYFRDCATHYAKSRSGAPDSTPAEWPRIKVALGFESATPAQATPKSPEKLKAEITDTLPLLTASDRAEVEQRLAAATTPRHLYELLSAAEGMAAVAAAESDDTEEAEGEPAEEEASTPEATEPSTAAATTSMPEAASMPVIEPTVEPAPSPAAVELPAPAAAPPPAAVATSPAAAPPAKASPPPATKDDPELAAMALLRAAKTRKDLGAAGVAISKMGLDAGARGRCMGVYNAAKESLPQ